MIFKKTLIIATAGVSMVSVSCTQDEVTEDAPPACNEEYTYDDDVQPIIMNNCATSGCHDGTQPPLLTNFNSVDNSKTRVEVRAVDLKSMPPSGPLTNEEMKKISCWIDQGAKEK